MHLFISSISWKYETGTVIVFMLIQMGIIWRLVILSSNTIISIILPDSASIFPADIWAIIKALEKKCICIQIHCFYRLTFVSPNFTIYEAGTSFDWDGDTKVCPFKF